ncbi:MAG: Uncharacterised protein [Alphaproteobacteria bacterium UBA4588]|nr:MAG: Uncharacterised protein [Alphaproteobacteria bacterium UBA4588]
MAGRLSADKSDVSDNTDKTSALKLHAQSSDDIKILSALLQDALIAGADMVFDKAENTFMLVANRYCWELQDAGQQMRCMCGVKFGTIGAVRTRGMTADKTQFYNLLAIEYDKAAQHIMLVFSGGVGIQLEVSSIMIIVRDLAEPHPSFARPDHSE